MTAAPRIYSGAKAAAFLEQAGIPSTIPTIRSSDDRLIHTCPFQYYLRRRLHLTSAFQTSDAMRMGSWYHTICEHVLLSKEDRDAAIPVIINSRLKELRATLRDYPEFGPTAIQTFIDKERTTAEEAWALFDQTYRLPGSSSAYQTGWVDFFKGPRFRVLDQEAILIHRHPDFPDAPRLVQPDALLYDHAKKELWIADFKTTGIDLITYANALRFEFQPLHYVSVAHDLLGEGILQKTYDLPTDVRVAGMLHFLVSSPDIHMGKEDRPYYWESHGKRVGVRGYMRHTSPKEWTITTYDEVDESDEPAITEVYYDEQEGLERLRDLTCKKPEKVIDFEAFPSRENYSRRLRTWLRGQGKYGYHAEKRAQSPCVNIARTFSGKVLDGRGNSNYVSSLERIHRYATIEAFPENFPQRAAGCVREDTRKETPYSGFYVTEDVRQWPDVARANHLIALPREPDGVTHETPNTVIPSETAK